MTRTFISSAILAVCTCLVAPCSASAQAASYMTALAIPPSTVGTCMPDDGAVRGARPDTPRLRVSRLLMKTRSPGGDREIAVYVDDAGVARGYSEIVMRQTG